MERIIVLYSQANETYKPLIERHLKVLKSYGIQFWNDQEPQLPDFREIDIVILMISSHFIASDIFQDKLSNVMAGQSQSKIFPIMIEPCSIKVISWLRNCSIIPDAGMSLSELSKNQMEKAIALLVDRVTTHLLDESSEQTFAHNKPPLILTNTHDFVKFRTGNFIYVDKTAHVYSLLQNEMTQCFLSRPRRFGKSLLLSMMKALFSGDKDLFRGLYIYDKYDFKPYPVIHMTFTQLEYDKTVNDHMALYYALQKYLGKIACENKIPVPDGPFLGSIIENLYKKMNRPIVLLIDEYDKPLLRYIKQPEIRKEMLLVLKDFFSPLKDLTGMIKFLLITGVSKFSQVSIFSDLNNLDDLTLHSEYATIAGFTQQELEHYFKNDIIALAQKERKSYDDILAQIKSWYDGYSWDGKHFVYAPFSISNLLKRGEFKNYWFSSATPTFLIDVIDELKQGNLSFDSFESFSMRDTDMEKYDISNIKLMPFLFQSGYLSIFETDAYMLKLRLPNMEVRMSFYQSLFEQISNKNIEHFDLLRQAIRKCDINQMMIHIKSIIATIPYQILEKKENVYHSHFYTILKTINEKTQSEISTNLGRIDTVMETHDTIFIFEFKMQNPQQGIKQIKKKQYADGYLNKNKKIVLIGVKFSEKNRNIDAYHYEELGNN
jgi:hypothetical protein